MSDKFMSWWTGDKKKDPMNVTVDDLKMKFERNVTNGYHMVTLASVTSDLGMGTSKGRPAVYKDFVRDSDFDNWGGVVYHNEKSKTAWFAISGNRLIEELTTGRTGSNVKLHMDEAARLFAIGLYTRDAILKA